MKHSLEKGARSGATMTHETPRRLEMKHPGTIDLFHHWLHLRAGRLAPYRAEFTPERFGRSLTANTFILEDQGEGHMRFRLAGAALYDLFGIELRGMSAASVMDEAERAKFRTLVSSVLPGARVAVAKVHLVAVGGEVLEAELLLAPMKNEFDQMNRILGAFHVFDDAPVASVPRRCHLVETRVEKLDVASGAPSAETTALPGFAEPSAGFDHSRPALTPIEGGNAGTAARRGHLRVVGGGDAGGSDY